MPGCRKRKQLNKFKRPLRRRDVVTRMLVDLGISYTESLGSEAAAEFLRTRDVPEHVIQRVIKD
ncbi:MAG: hypothetical protein E6Q34_07370 [Burkholderiaceae bacterium]|nr:MAG: hypothetical protein E6Q34_07370 [Burkholderiaceae bacterium]